MTGYEFRDKYYTIEWMSTATWCFLQMIITIFILIIYSPSKLKNVLTFHGEVQSSTEHQNSEGIEMEDIDEEDEPEAKNQKANINK